MFPVSFKINSYYIKNSFLFCIKSNEFQLQKYKKNVSFNVLNINKIDTRFIRFPSLRIFSNRKRCYYVPRDPVSLREGSVALLSKLPALEQRVLRAQTLVEKVCKPFREMEQRAETEVRGR